MRRYESGLKGSAAGGAVSHTHRVNTDLCERKGDVPAQIGHVAPRGTRYPSAESLIKGRLI